jgi:hypothetical protein
MKNNRQFLLDIARGKHPKSQSFIIYYSNIAGKIKIRDRIPFDSKKNIYIKYIPSGMGTNFPSCEEDVKL